MPESKHHSKRMTNAEWNKRKHRKIHYYRYGNSPKRYIPKGETDAE